MMGVCLALIFGGDERAEEYFCPIEYVGIGC